MTDDPKRIEAWRRWSPLLLTSAIATLAGLGWYGPFSISYLMHAVIIGADFSILTIAFWRWHLKSSGSWIWLVASFVLIVGGFYWSMDQTFGVSHADGSSWNLAGQFFSTVALVFFGVLTGARGRLAKTLEAKVH